jgi:hypothetical protein
MKFFWACRTFAGDNDVETFVLHFEIHWAKRVVTVEDEEKKFNMDAALSKRDASARVKLRWN